MTINITDRKNHRRGWGHFKPSHAPQPGPVQAVIRNRGCTAPTTARILEIFTGVARHELTQADGTVLRTFHPQLTELQRQVLDLLDIPTSIYSPNT